MNSFLILFYDYGAKGSSAVLSQAPFASACPTITPILWLWHHSVKHWGDLCKLLLCSLLPSRSWMQRGVRCSPLFLLTLTQICLLSPQDWSGGQSTSNFPSTCLLSKPLVSFLTSGKPNFRPWYLQRLFSLDMQSQAFGTQYIFFSKILALESWKLFGFLDSEFQMHTQNLKSQ